MAAVAVSLLLNVPWLNSMKNDTIGTIRSLCYTHIEQRWYLWLIVFPCFLFCSVVASVFLFITKFKGNPWQPDPFYKVGNLAGMYD